LKRTYPQKIKPVQASQIDRDDSAESSKQTTGTGRVRSLATLGLAISVGASGILLPRTGDNARASEFAPIAEPTAEIQPISANGLSTTAQVDGSSVEPDAALANPVAVKVQQGQTLWELSQDYALEPNALATANGIQPETVLQVGQNLTIPPAVGVASEQNAGNTAIALPEGVAEVNPEQQLNLTGSEPLDNSAQSGYQSTASTPLVTIPAIPQSSIVGHNTDGAIESLKKQENRTSTPGRSELASEDGANLSTSPISLGSPAAKPESSGSAMQTAIPAIESIEKSLVTPSLPSAVTVLPPGSSSVSDFGANAQSNADVLYSVRPGDTVDAIAKVHKVSPKDLIAANKLGNPNLLNVNQRLKIPQVGSNNPTMQSAASISANSTSFSSATEVPASFNPSSSTPEIGGAGVPASTPTVPIVSPLANLEGLNNISAPMVPKINSIPLTQVSQSISDPGKLELQGEPTFTGAVNTSALPTIPATATVIDRTTGEYPQTTNLARLSSTQDLGGNATTAISLLNVPVADPLAGELPMSDTSAELPATESLNPYAERLRAEIVRLRSEYRAERNSIGANSLALAPNDAPLAPVATANPSENSENLNNPYLYTPEYNQAVQNEISRPQSRAWSEQVKKQQQERFDAARAAELQPINLTPASTSTSTLEQPVVATAPLGAEGYDPLSNPSLGRMVSPELPPLSGADTYLPQGSKEQQSAKGFIWPAKGVFTSGYGWRWGRMHKGIDIAGPIGTPIMAAADGVVTYAEWNDGGYGYLVEITHPDGSETVYAHNSRILVQKGQRVAQGEQISEMGSTGFSTGPHLHFEIHPSGQGAVNPMAFLPDDSSSASR
jgi:murein DD-endopeptidase MepM/ murein hydrolase activator NlpD